MFATSKSTTPKGQATRQQRSPSLLVLAVFALSLPLVLLSGCGNPGTGNSDVTALANQAPFVRQIQVHLATAPSISTSLRIAQRHLYPFATSNVGLMQPAVDGQGNLWVGEMHANHLGRLNSKTGRVTSWIPAGAQYGIMTTTVDAQGNVWFAEQNANYIGRFDGRQQTFRIFPLGTWRGSPLGPQDLYFDNRGMLWFTAEAGGVLGRLDLVTGAI